ncbi:MAG: hypothetical protein AB4352_18885 [Hormoscilla sp.]
MRFYTFILLFLSAIVSSQLIISHSNNSEHSEVTVQLAQSQEDSPNRSDRDRGTSQRTGTGRREIMAFTHSDCCQL